MMKLHGMVAATALLLAGCSGTETESTTVETPDLPPVEVPAGPEVGTLEWAMAGDWRTDEARARDEWRNPAATLEFFEVANDETVVEIFPGGGWYSSILAPYLSSGGGTLIAAGFDPDAFPEERRAGIEDRVKAYADAFASDTETFGTVELSEFSAISGPLAEAETVDTVLAFRNVHSWMGGDYAAKFFTDAYAALKPGGMLGVVQHRLPSSAEQDPRASSGYVHEDFVKALAAAAGFEFVEASEINANPKDTADHPFGVWTLPPRSRTADREGNAPEGFDPAIYAAIGESDRMTLKFMKPLPEEPDLEPVE